LLVYLKKLLDWSANPTTRTATEAHIRGWRYRLDPEAYAREVLKVTWWDRQAAIARALLKHKRVFVKASHSVGKSFLAGGLVNWFLDSFDPGLCITTAPNAPQVRDILWKEVRVQRPADLRAALQPKAPRMESSPDHFAVGYTARDDSGFQGRHEEYVLIVFDECVGVQGPFWDAAEGMMTGPHSYFLAICNPTDTGSRAYLECQNTEKWHVIEISALEHPNIAAELAGLPAPYPKAVRLSWIEERIREWCTPDSAEAGCFEFPPGTGRWYRPGSLFESRVLGRWPSRGSDSVWSDAMWQASITPGVVDAHAPLRIGCDKARFGDDFSSFVVRRGACVLWHETHNGWDNNQIAGRLKRLCQEYAQPGEEAKAVVCLVDDLQGGVTDQAGGYSFVEVNSSTRAVEPENYPNKRSELWFAVADRAASGRLDLSRLPEESRNLLRRQLMAPTWKADAQGRRVVEPKVDTKKRIGRSPDDADALNLAFAGEAGDWSDAVRSEDEMETVDSEARDVSRLW
jgi:hypothetical protein